MTIHKYLTLLALVLMLSACSGGGSSGSSSTTSSKGVWDQMKWNEKNWQ